MNTYINALRPHGGRGNKAFLSERSFPDTHINQSVEVLLYSGHSQGKLADRVRAWCRALATGLSKPDLPSNPILVLRVGNTPCAGLRGDCQYANDG